jgi:hypothetical protein
MAPIGIAGNLSGFQGFVVKPDFISYFIGPPLSIVCNCLFLFCSHPLVMIAVASLFKRLVSVRGGAASPPPTVDTRKQVVFILGGPGSGKGTACERLAKVRTNFRVQRTPAKVN